MNKIINNLIKINLFIIFCFNIALSAESNFFIVVKVDNEIITNVDIVEEAKYLTALNNNLKKINKNSLIKIARDSLIREKIKKNELKKYFPSLSIKNDALKKIYLKNFYQKLNLNSLDEFRVYLNNQNINISTVEEKIKTEILWNQFIYNTYGNLLNINVEELKKKVDDNKYNNNKNTKYLLSEIVFSLNNKKEFEKKNREIREKIKTNGFKTAANIYSISDTGKFGGRIGLIDEKQLSKKIIEKIKLTNIGETTETINIANGYLILKLEDIIIEEFNKDLKNELDNLIRFETDRQLNQFSIIHYNKIKLNSNITNE